MPYKDPAKRREFVNRRRAERRNGSPPKPPVKKAQMLRCDQCGGEFYRSPANRRGTHNFCSAKCMGQWQAQHNIGESHPRYKGDDIRACFNCGKPVVRRRWAWNKRTMTFCDRKCFGEWKAKNWTGAENPCWRGGHPPYYGPNWLRQSREARRRDSHQCQCCGKTQSDCRRELDVHHIIPFRLFSEPRKANALSNLVTLCEECHHSAEQYSKSGNVPDWPALKRLMLQATLIGQGQTG